MPRTVPFLAALLLVAAAPALAQPDYHYSLSASETDPFVNQVAPGPVLFPVYLWLYDTCEDGLAAFEADIDASSPLVVLDFFPRNGVLSVFGVPQLVLAVPGCPTAPFLVGEILVLDPGKLGGTVCLVPSAANGYNVSVDCSANPVIHPNGTYGYSSHASLPPCGELSFCSLLVEDRSWGQIKGLYR